MGRFIIGFTLLALASVGQAEIQRTETLEPIKKEIAKNPKGTLVLLDVGGTLIAFNDAIFHPAYEKWKKDWFLTHYPNLTAEEKARLHLIQENSLKKYQMTDSQWPELIRSAQEQGAKVVALTKVTVIDPNRPSRFKDFGFPFKDDLSELADGNSYAYSQGVIQTSAELKGPVVKEILSHLPSRPEKIIFVDDRMSQIKSVDETCQKEMIACTAFHYVAFDTLPPLDEKVVDYQLSNLVRDHRWLNESEAKIEMKRASEKRNPS